VEEVLAFPEAVGYGKNSVGGRGGTVMFVTTLNDSGTGSLREAFEASGPRIIIPLIGGRVNVTSPIQVDNPFVTYAGQGGVGDGLMITKEGQNGPILEIRTNDVIIRHLKIRYAENYLNDTNADSLRVIGSNAHDVIIDHCSLSWSPDGNLDATQGCYNITVQNSILHQCLSDEKNSLNKYQVNKITYYNNVFSSTEQRNPAIASSGPNDISGYDDDPNMHPEFEVINNVIFRFNYATTFSRQYKAKLNWIGNRLLMEGNKRRGLQCSNFTTINEVAAEDRVQVYMFGNTDDKWRTSITTPTDWNEEFSLSQGTQLSAYEDNPPPGWVEGTNGIYYRIPQEFRRITPHQTPIIADGNTIVDAGLENSETLWESLRDTVGASLPGRDSEDAEVVTIINSYITDYDKARISTEYPQKDTNGSNTFPVITSGTPPLDSNGDGIPDAWEAANMPNGATANDIAPNGYTWIENYLNGVDSNAQLAFPTAVGAGAYATGGRGGKVCHVDTLTWDTAVVYDAATDSYSGGFYNMFYELDIPAKEIVFDISGTIDVPAYTVLDFSTKTNKGNITVSGQTSNIVFSTDYFQIENISNLIWRYTSFYNIGTVAPGADVIWISSSTNNISENIIFDHCSAFYGGDECFSIASSSGQGEINNITVQWCMMAASSKGSIIGAYTGESNATTAYCSYQDISYRFPNMLGYGSNSQQDAYNIFVGNYTSRLIRTTGDANFNVQNMYVQANKDDYGRHRMQYQSTAPCQLYAGGTIITGVQDTPAYPEFDDVWLTFSGSDIGADLPIPNDARASSAFPLIGKAGTIYDTADIKTEVLPYTGNTKRLTNDGSVVEDEYALDTFYRDLGVNKQTTTSQTRFPAIQYPQPNSATPLISTLKDGIPDIWRAANMNGESHDDIVPGTGYTWLETFHNQVDVVPAQQLAFPTAYGGGAYASGGRGGNVYKVTNLLDDGSVGSFRWAVTQARPATVIFDVSGTIELTSSLIVQGDDLTVAGQTAPQGGITITSDDKNIRFGISRFNSIENHIWRYVKVRAQYQGNDEYQNIQQYAGNGVSDYTRNIIMDHLSISGAQYMAYSIRGEGSENVTLQNIMFGENAKTALFGDTDDLFSKDFTFRNNTMYHSTHRVPNTSAQNVDVYNNVVYDWVNRLTVIKNGTAINHFNNYYYKGTRTNLGSSWNGAPENFTWEVNGITTNATDPVTIYSKNNVIQDLYVYDDNDADISNEFQDDRYIWMHHAGQLVDGTEIIPDRQQRNKADDSYFVENPMSYVGRVPSAFLTAEQAKTAVPNNSGAYKYLKDDGTVGEFRDTLDTEYHSNIINDNATDFAYDGGVNDPINSTLFTNFVASISTTPINSRPVDFYDTNDYIPQAYLDANGITGNSTVHNEIQPSGYTLLEEYMNQVDEIGGTVPTTTTTTTLTPTTTTTTSLNPPFDSGILQNGTFDDSTGVFVPSGGWSVSGGTLNKDSSGDKFVRLSLSTDMKVGSTYNITFTISNAGTARTAWYAGNQNELIEGNTNYGNGTHTISGYTHTVADRNEITIKGSNSGGGGPFSIDNISVVSTDVYPWDNAVGANDIDSNDGWSASSTFFTNSMVSTDVGQNFSIGIEARSTSTSNAGYRFNRLPGLTVGTPYKATIRYKNTSTTTPVQHPFNSWREVSDVTYPSGTFSTGQWVEAEVLFTPNDPVNDAEMRFYPLANAAGGRTVGDLLEISSIIIEEVVVEELFTGNAAADADGEVNSTAGFSTLGNTSVSVNSTDQGFGSYCIELENGAAGGGFDRVEYDVTVEVGEQYNVSIWARELVGSDGRIQLWDGVTGWSTVVLTNTWTEYTATVTATATTMKMRFYPNNGSGAAGDKILLDNISVTKV